MSSPMAPVPAGEAARPPHDSPAIAWFARLALVPVGILAFGAGHALAPVIWHGDPARLGVVRMAFALLIAFVAGPPIVFLLSSAFGRVVREWRRRG